MTKLLFISSLTILLFFSAAGCHRKLSDEEELALYKSVKNGDMVALRAAISSGVNPNLHVGGTGMSDHMHLITTAVVSPTLEPLTYLITSGADVNIVESDGSTPLINAILLNKCDAARLLLKSGADPTIKYSRAGIAGLGEYTGLSSSQIFNKRTKELPKRIESDPECWKEVAHLLER